MLNDQKIFTDACPVTHETIHSLCVYERLLTEWNEKFNLISATTLPQIWSRHFLDSAQLMQYIPDRATTVADMGAGAGFPGLVLAILAQGSGRKLQIIEIEATGKKADFLQAVIDELKLDAVVRRDRIEAIRDLKADIVTARALKALPELLVYANYLTHKDTICLFPKGRAAPEELTAARKCWTFELETHPSRSDDSGTILVLKGLRYKR